MIHNNTDTQKAGLIVIGNEILTGRTQDTNTQWIAERLLSHGIVLSEVRIISDHEENIVHAVNALRERLDYVFTTGGIGPTHDDITAESVAKAFDLPFIRNEDAYKMLIEHYGGEEHVNEARAKMAMMPEGIRLILNPVSGAPGFNVENVFVMAGVPRIMHGMMDHVMEMITPGKPVLSSTVTCPLQESEVAQDLKGLQDEFPNVEIGSYPHYRGGILGLSLVLRATDEDLLMKATERLVEIIRNLGAEPNAMSVLTSEKVA